MIIIGKLGKKGSFILLFLYSLFCTAQSEISGVILDVDSNPIPDASIRITELQNIGTVSNFNGDFTLSIQNNKCTLKVSAIGFKDQTKKVEFNNEKLFVTIVLEKSISQLSEVLIQGKSTTEQKREKGYALEILETAALKNTTTDLNQVIKGTPGINIRESGGLGSGFSLSLNGLMGNQIRYFIDGLPMENFGSALSLNNFPVNLIEKIEIYKGVVPISLGADALGGAINLVSGLKNKTYLDASYSYGSFNTHRSALNAQYTDNDKGYFLKAVSFFNHSDNDYLMKDVPVFDLELGNSLGETDIKRFNDQYTSAMLTVEAGILNKKIADELSFKITTATNRNNYQHPDNNILRVFGDFYTKNNTALYSATYTKKIEKLAIKAYSLYGKISETIDDSNTRKFNWTGNFVERASNDPRGELGSARSLFKLTDEIIRNQINLNYNIHKQQYLELNYSQNYLKRKGEDEVNTLNTSFEIPNTINKNIIGLAYTIKNKTYELSAFGKQYWFSGAIKSINTPEINSNSSNTGYGSVFSYHPLKFITLKASYEKAIRLPETYEVLGDGLFITPNSEIQPETSDNFNLGYRISKGIHNFQLQHETNLFYRKSVDFIRFNALGPFGEYENLSSVTAKGIESSVKASYNNQIEAQFNFTYQNLTDQEEFDEGLPNANFDSQLPNIPYLFWNARAGSYFLKKKLSLFWTTRYVKEFFLTWENSGNIIDKNIIPSQLTHNIDIDYAMKNGKYNISASFTNITDELVFDNFNIQKPGRAFYLKFRYFISNN